MEGFFRVVRIEIGRVGFCVLYRFVFGCGVRFWKGCYLFFEVIFEGCFWLGVVCC